MKIIRHEGSAELQTNGHGLIKRGEIREMETGYACDLIAQKVISPADDAALEEYTAVRAARLTAAIEAGTFFACDQCLQEFPAAKFNDNEGKCPHCNAREAQEV